MFDIGFWELLVIAIVLLLVMGPERLPEVARQAAFLLRKARQGMYRLRNEMQGEIDGSPFADLQAARREMSDFKNDIKQFGHELADSVEERKRTATESTQSINTPAQPASPKKEDHDSSGSQQAVKKKAAKKVGKKAGKKAVKKGAAKKAPVTKKKTVTQSASTKKTTTKKTTTKKTSTKRTSKKKPTPSANKAANKDS